MPERSPPAASVRRSASFKSPSSKGKSCTSLFRKRVLIFRALASRLGNRIAPDVHAAPPAFDVTPHRYIAAIFTERGVARAPYTDSLRALASATHSVAAK